ncbi:hypothetical protein like AT3G05975 [Hibiscus trionum]|uniref:Late embryogenesis abundant protein LEA-2 subgroup domain-containing protein n=1 Tax=Hibiscus trionum TaxID=183268 RepID=A0A9W7MUC2_HIBTR|nr:hypothetical protein like AT3G05975 [Hibiscus trionum]
MVQAKASRGLKICCGVIVVLVIVAIVFTILALTLFKPKNPEITVYPQGLENIGLGSGGVLNASTINSTVAMVVTVNNRNYGTFKFKNATGFINYRGDVVARVPIQQSVVPARGKFNISTVADFMVERLIMNATFWADVLSGSVNFSSDATLHGKVTMFKVLKIHASALSRCDLSIFIRTRNIQSICKTRIKL